MASFNEYRKMVLAKGFDMDGYFGNQCWDGFAHYCRYLGYPIVNCTRSGYVKDLWEQRKTNGILNNFVEVKIMQPGDVAIFKEVAGWTPVSHVAMFVRDLGNGYGLFLGQNQGGRNGAYNEVKFPYSATYDTAFRPKCFVKPKIETVMNYVPNDFVYERAKFTCQVDAIKIRKAPSLKGEDTGLCYENGQSVFYDGYVKRDGYVWISWLSASTKTRRWMAVREIATNRAYGKFE